MKLGGALAVIGVLVMLVAPAAAGAAAAPTVVLSPKPGQRVKLNQLDVVVRAGDEYGDLKVKLNGVEIGRDFAPGAGGLRSLRVSASHGLRRGRNVLSVQARRGILVRRATVRFTVTRKAPLVGAGRDRSVTVGTSFALAARAVGPGATAAASSPRWTVVGSPRGSRVRKLTALKPALTSAQRAASDPDTLPLTPLKPALTPDRPGRYTLKLTAGREASAPSDTVTFDARPKDPLVPIDTAVPAVASTAGAAQPGVRVGATTVRAPYLFSDAAGKGKYTAGGPCCDASKIFAKWHVVAVSREDTRVLWNRTYGYCFVDNGTNSDLWKECRSPDNPTPGQPYKPVLVNSSAEIVREAPGNGQAGALIIAAVFPTVDNDASGRTSANFLGFLQHVGYRPPAEVEPPPNTMIGVPGMQVGEAYISAAPDGSLPGYLTADQNYRYHFLPSARPTFDTRSATTCDTPPGYCTVSQTFAGHTVSGGTGKGTGGYLVSAWDPHTLAPLSSFFEVIDDDSTHSQDGTLNLLAALRRLRDDGSIIAITTLHTPGQDPGTLIGGPPDAWNALKDLIASIGGTKNGFLRSVTTPNTDYTLIGWGGAGENGGKEASGAGDAARLRGALVPDTRFALRPADVSSVGPPAERLNQLVVRPTSSNWRYPDARTPEGAVIQCIGAHLAKGTDIRATYRDLLTEAQATALQQAVTNTTRDELAPVPGTSLTCTPTVEAFTTGKAQLVKELGRVANVRGYLAELSTPEITKGQDVWGQALILGNQLKDALTEEDEQKQVIASSFGFVATLLDLIAPGISATVEEGEKLTHAVEAAASAFELANRGVERAADGGPSEDPRAAAIDLASHLQLEAQAATASFTQIGDVIVGDPDKLKEVGDNAGCNADPGAQGGCAPGMAEYSTTGPEIADLTDVAVRAMGREIYGTLVPQTYTTWDTGVTEFPTDPYAHFYCLGTSSPFGVVPASAYAAGLEESNYGVPPRYRVLLSIRSAVTWDWIPQAVSQRMFGAIGDHWDSEGSGLGMDPLTYLRDMRERFEPGSYSCSYDR